MAALMPLDINANVATKMKSAAPAATKPKQPALSKHDKKDHAPPPPAEVYEPKSTDRPDGAIYHTGRLLGKGGFAICYEGLLSGTKHLYALKIVKSKMGLKKMEQKFQTELQIHSKMRHPNIVQFHRAFTYQESTYIVLEICRNGSLMDMVKKRKHLTEPEVRFYTIQIAGAIKHMHSKGVIHRDLKMGNIFLDDNMNVKIGDFGLAALLISGKDMATVRRTTLCGTPNYIAPEILEKGQKGHDQAVDIWSLGIIVFAMLTGRPPFQSATQDEIYRKAKELDYDWPSPEKMTYPISKDSKTFVASMLLPADERPACDELVQHPFFTSGFVPGTRDMLPDFRERTPMSTNFASRKFTTLASQNYQELCTNSGVGPLAKPQRLRASLYKEMQAEEKWGRTPSIPLAEGIVYRPFDEIVKEYKQSDSYRDTLATRLVEREGLDRPTLRGLPASLAGGNAQSYAAQQRAQHQPTLSSAPPRRPKTHPEAESAVRRRVDLIEVTAEKDPQGRRTPPMDEIERQTAIVTEAEPRRSRREPQVSATTEPESRRSRREPEISAPSQERQQSARTKDDIPETVYGLSKKPSAVPRSRAPTRSVAERLADDVAKLSLERQTSTRRSKPESNDGHPEDIYDTVFSPSETKDMMWRSKPADVLRRLEIFYNEVDRALKSRSFGSVTRVEQGEAPLVVKWVDYTNKFGLGYILNDGSVGCLFRSMPTSMNSEKPLPPISVVVRNCERHLQRREDESYVDRNQLFPVTDAGDVEFYENRGDSGIITSKVPASTYAVSTIPGKLGRLEKGKDEWDNKKRENIVLWKKFANYMIGYGRDDIQPADEDDATPNHVTHQNVLIIYYQRIGDVGIWGFSDGSFQFNFPDHTKIVLSSDGSWCDFYHLPMEAARDLAEKGTIKPSALSERQHLSYSTQSFLNFMTKPSTRTRARALPEIDPMIQGIPAANDFRRKIEFVKKVVGEWITYGGIGRGAKEPETRLRWTGYRDVNVKAPVKHVWCTVGAYGGDDRRTAWFDPRNPDKIVPDIQS